MTLIAGIFILAQFFRPKRKNPTTDPGHLIHNYSGIPPAVLAKIEHACFDCHSNGMQWPWYSIITPINYLIARDVTQGRRHVNFSEWGAQKSQVYTLPLRGEILPW